MNFNVVQQLHEEMGRVSSLLDSHELQAEVSIRAFLDDNFRKILLLSAASYFEDRMTEAVKSFVSSSTNKHPLIISLVSRKAIDRQYHTWFDWNARNANKFFSLFGRDFLQFMKRKIRRDRDLNKSIMSFIEIGRERNRLVHQNFGAFTLEKTSMEIYDLFQGAQRFVDLFPDTFIEFYPPKQDM